MKKLLLLDADVVIDLHSLGLFEKISRSYHLFVTREVFEEAKFYRKRNQKIPIKIREKVTLIDDIKVECLAEVQKEAREARRGHGRTRRTALRAQGQQDPGVLEVLLVRQVPAVEARQPVSAVVGPRHAEVPQCVRVLVEFGIGDFELLVIVAPGKGGREGEVAAAAEQIHGHLVGQRAAGGPFRRVLEHALVRHVVAVGEKPQLGLAVGAQGQRGLEPLHFCLQTLESLARKAAVEVVRGRGGPGPLDREALEAALVEVAPAGGAAPPAGPPQIPAQWAPPVQPPP